MEMFLGWGQGSETFSESQCVSVLWEVSIGRGSYFEVLAEDVPKNQLSGEDSEFLSQP